MDKIIAQKTFIMKGSDLKRAFAEDREFKADRRHGRHKVHYMTHAEGWIMVRRDGVTPFTMSEREWRGLQPWTYK
jgi:hypothetical protein